MLLKLLLIILICNLIITYKKLQSLIAPAILFVGGFTVAVFVAILYEKEWGMYKVHTETFWCILIGTTLFSFINILFNKGDVKSSHRDLSNITFEQLFKTKNLTRLLIASLFLQLYVFYTKLTTFINYYGTSDIATLLFTIRMDGRGDDKVILFSSLFSNMNYACSCLYFFWCTIMAMYIIGKGRNKTIFFLLLLNMFMQFIKEMLGGDRGTSINSIFCFGVIFLCKYASIKKQLKIPKKYLAYIAVVAILIASSLKASALLMGREQVEESTAAYQFAVYCGAEIKNLDIWFGHPTHSDWFGQSTLSVLVGELNTKFDVGILETKYSTIDMFNTFGIFNLGNVLTTFYNFFQDGGYFGVCMFTLLMSLFASLVYSNVKKVRNPIHTNVIDVLYAKIAFSLLMCFFANRFYNEIISIMFLRYLLYCWILGFFFKKFIYKIKL